MRYLLITAVLLASCRLKVLPAPAPIHDTVYLPAPVVDETLEPVIDTVYLPGQNCDSMAMWLRAARQKLNKINYYVNICNRNPKQDKFLRGWMNRALN